ncbi:hypothetical protein KKH05_03380 [Patescibacteria group bacterium]|nr:hypothetical protein [Patescibacteria group bacterium]
MTIHKEGLDMTITPDSIVDVSLRAIRGAITSAVGDDALRIGLGKIMEVVFDERDALKIDTIVDILDEGRPGSFERLEERREEALHNMHGINADELEEVIALLLPKPEDNDWTRKAVRILDRLVWAEPDQFWKRVTRIRDHSRAHQLADWINRAADAIERSAR